MRVAQRAFIARTKSNGELPTKKPLLRSKRTEDSTTAPGVRQINRSKTLSPLVAAPAYPPPAAERTRPLSGSFIPLQKTSESVYWRGIAKLERDDDAGALADFEAYLHDHPNDVSAIGCRALLLRRQGRYLEALKELDRGITLEPTSYNLHVERGICHYMVDDYPAAICDFEVGLPYVREEANLTYQGYGWSLLYTGQLEKALRAFERARQLDPSDPDIDEAILLTKAVIDSH